MADSTGGLGGSAERRPILLRAVLRERHWQTYRRFRKEYDRAASRLDKELVGTCPSDSTYRRWLSGRIGGIPRAEPCTVLEEMFPGYTAEQLFEPHHDPQGDDTRGLLGPVSGPDNEPVAIDQENITAYDASRRPFTAVSSQLDLAQQRINGALNQTTQGRSAGEVLDTLSADLAELRGWVEDMKRRELLRALGSTAVTAVSTAWDQAALAGDLNFDERDRVIGALRTPSRVDELVIGHIEDVLWSVMRQDDALGPRAVLSTVLSQRGLVETILPECPSELRPRLLSLYANISRFAGWLSFDLANFDVAQCYYEQARIAAHEAENTELGIMSLCNMSHLSIWRGQPRVGIDHALAAQGWANAIDDVPLRSYVADISARAFSADGNRRACMDAIDRAHRELATVRTPCPPATSLAYFYSQGQFAATYSECLLNLNEARAAVDAATESLRLMDHSFVRNHAFAMIKYSDACIASDEIDEAARVLGDSAKLAARNHSARLVERLHRARGVLTHCQDTTAVKNLDERLIVYGFRHAE